MRVAVYARVSTDQQSPDSQLRDLRAYCQDRGWQIVKEYVDQDESGANESRPALDCLMMDARRHRFKAVLVWRFDRFARSVLHLVKALNEFQSLRLDFISHQERMDTSTAGGRLLFEISAAFAEFEREILRERVKAGLRAARAKGKRLGRPSKDIDIVAAVDLHLKGHSLASIARQLKISSRSLARKFPDWGDQWLRPLAKSSFFDCL
jgi:DNA invertase Pin-like site-specific DNA recombinase